MNRLKFLKCLKDEVRRLVAEDLDEDTTFAQLRVDPRFYTVSRSEVHSLYKNLQADIKVEIKQERRIAETRSEMDRIKKSCQRSNNFLVYGYTYNFFEKTANVWQNRFVVTEHCKSVEVCDLFQGKSKSFKAEVSGRIEFVCTLAYPFLLFIVQDEEKKPDGSCIHYFYLARFNPKTDKLQMVHRIEFDGRYNPNDCNILVDPSDASKFVLATEQRVKVYKLVDEQIQVGKSVENLSWIFIFCISYYNDRIYDLQPGWNELGEVNDFAESKVEIYDLEQNESEIMEFDSLPNNLSFTAQSYDSGYNNYTFEWVHDCLFASVKFQLTGDYGVVFTNFQTKSWVVTNFASSFFIDRIHFASGKDLMISTKDSKTYKLPIGKPDSLRNMAWLKLINLFGQAGDNDPYFEARQYLPLNSDIQPHIFT